MKPTYTILAAFLFSIMLFSCEEGDIMDDSTTKDSSSPELAYLSDGSAGGGVVVSPGTGNGDTTQQYKPGVITAGEWNDLENWDFWYQLIEKDTFAFATEYWSTYPIHNRYSLIVENSLGQPVVDLSVTLKSGTQELWTARTDNKGKAEFWTNAFSPAKSQLYSNLKFYIDDKPINTSVIPFDQGVNTITYANKAKPKTLNVVFVVDATGSMGDELEYLKTEVLDVINNVKSNNHQLYVKMGSVFYRDKGDEYVTKVSQLSDNISNTVDFIKNQKAEGGGDYPEAVHTAIKVATQQLKWSEDAVSRVMFLLLDAPPHYESGVIESIQEDVKLAAKKGIKIVPISASGIDKPTEFLMRFMSTLSNSTYVFITNHSGVGNDHITPTVGEYEVEYLNNLMVRLINEYVE